MLGNKKKPSGHQFRKKRKLNIEDNKKLAEQMSKFIITPNPNIPSPAELISSFGLCPSNQANYNATTSSSIVLNSPSTEDFNAPDSS